MINKLVHLLFLFFFFSLNTFGQSLSDLVEQNEKAVFLILTYDKYGNPLSQGTGFFININGTAITNVHVLENAAKAEIKTTDNQTYSIAQILDFDNNFDLAKFKIANPNNNKLSAITIADLPPKKGEDIFVISNPQGLENTVSNGIVSSVREVEGYGHVIQVTAPVSPGSSGAPVFNSKGQVIGVITFLVNDGQNLNFAIDIKRVNELTENKQLALDDANAGLDYEDFMIQAVKAYLEENYQKAIIYFNKEIERNPNNGGAYFYRGIQKHKLEDYQGAINDFTQAIKNKPNDAEAYYSRGTAKGKLEDYQGAINDFTQAIKIKPDYAKAFDNRGNTKGKLGDYQGAINDYTHAIKIKPDYADVYFNRGYTKGTLKDYQGAINDFTQAIKIKPDFAYAYYNRGVSKDELEDYQGAINDYTQAIKIKPDYADAYYLRGFVKILNSRDGCLDLSTAGELGLSKAYELIRKYCN